MKKFLLLVIAALTLAFVTPANAAVTGTHHHGSKATKHVAAKHHKHVGRAHHHKAA